jgi:hypothetical protein
MSEKTSHSEEEIDLGQLFRLIGKGFNKFGDLITGIFRFGWNLIIQIVLFFMKHTLKFCIAIFIGAVIGFGVDYSGDPEYEASMVVRPNYSSGRQLYKNIAYYDELVKQKNFNLLSTTFGISEEQAQTLVSFEIEPVINDNYMLSTYDEFLSSIDSTVALNFEYESYTENFKNYSFSEHEIVVVSNSNTIFDKLENAIVQGIVNNEYFEKLESAEKLILARNEDYLTSSLQNVDTLRQVYQEVLLAEAKKQTSQGTNINMASSTKESKELELFQEEVRINKGLDGINRTRVKKVEILNIISSFQKIGFKKNRLLDRSTLRFSVLAFFGLLAFLVWVELAPIIRKKQ